MNAEKSTQPQGAGRPATFVAWLIGERFLRAGISAVALAVVARHLAPQGFGALNFALTVIGIAMPLAQLGLDLVVVRELVRTPARASELLGTATVLRLFVGMACAGLVLALGRAMPGLAGAQPALAPLCLMLIVQAFETPDLWFRCEVKSWPTTVARTTAIVGGAAAKIVLAVSGAGVAAFAWVSVAELAAFEAGLWCLYRREPHARSRWRWNGAIAKTLVRESWLYAVAATLGGMAFRIDQVCVATFLGDAAVGVYFAALRLIEIPTFVASSMAAALFPALAADERSIESGRFEITTGVLVAIAWMTAIGTTLVGPAISQLIFGQAYAGAATSLVIRAWAMLPFFSGIVRTQLITAMHSPGTQFATVATGIAVQIALNVLLIPRLGLTGAALAFLGTELFVAWALPIFLPTLRPCLQPQARAWLLVWRPQAWPQLVAAVRGAPRRPAEPDSATIHVR